MKLRRKSLLVLGLAIFLVLALAVGAYAVEDLDSFPAEVDPQSWAVPENMTWADWNDNPAIDWTKEDLPNATVQKGLVILVDYTDLPFVMTQEVGSDLLGNPQIQVAEEDLAEWWENYLNVPSELNNWTSIDSFWRENSYGNWRVEIDAYGPYHLEGMEWEYGVDSKQGASGAMRNITLETMALFLKENQDLI